MKKCNIDRSHYLFDNQALVSLIVPLIIEQLLTVLVGMQIPLWSQMLVKQRCLEFRW